MKFLRKLAAKILWILTMLIPHKNRFIIYYINDFLYCRYFSKLTLRGIIFCFSKGYLPYEYFAYQMPFNENKSYIPAYFNYKKTDLNGYFNYLLCNKILCEGYLKSILCEIKNLQVVESIGYIENRQLHSLNNSIISGDYKSLDPVLEKSDLILKPVFGSKGKGILILKKALSYYLLDNEQYDWVKLIQTLENLDNYIIQERIKQTGFSNNIYPESLNTIRIATMIDPVTKIPFVGYAVHRFGSHYSGYKDNFNQGGLSSLIDINTGILSRAFFVTLEGKIEETEFHPLSRKPIYNEQIPGWEILTKSLLEMASKMPFFKYVGWDIILTSNIFYLLEGNNCPGLDLVQIHKPIKEFTRAWNFFEYYNFID
jgi:hypothetical protein